MAKDKFDAVQWKGCPTPELDKLVQGQEHKLEIQGETLFITTPKGKVLINPSDYIFKDAQGELNTCKQDVFEQTYEKAD